MGEELVGMEALRVLAREAVLAGFREQVRDPDAYLCEDVRMPGPVYDRWQTLIFVKTDFARLTVKTFFNFVRGGQLTSTLLSAQAGAVSEKLILDTMREMSNVTGGHLKRRLQRLGRPAGLSLPLVTRGIDEVFFRTPDMRNFFQDVCTLIRRGSGEFPTVVQYEILDTELLAEFRFVSDELVAADDDGDIEFL